MSLKVAINITKGWPNPYIVEDSLHSAVALAQGDVVTINASRQWAKGATATGSAYIIMVDSTDPTTGRAALDPSYIQVPYGAIHGISLRNALEIEVSNYSLLLDDGITAANLKVGSVLSAPEGKIKIAEVGEIVIGTVVKVPYNLGGTNYLTFIPEDNKRIAPVLVNT